MHRFLGTKKALTGVSLAIAGAGYLALFSSLEVNYLLKYALVMLPIQAGVLIYLFAWKLRQP
ncbi:MAG TPA: hypothetical protein IGS53_02565 [Leptolyngbyaceae cyanobacterium M33_DOE_097]|uniref:Uncharacterized protein n=1 Tax=Oscillatoriales cyanobacterium SpSt-418 TaxID=2282169 RepID=A0A7C3PLN7_9CYAN|nr:hypothetical protein [Leptolyngbyaceae cyanobacterium M33_DOE_097]